MSDIKETGPARRNALTGPTYLTIFRMILSLVFFAFILVPATWARIVALIVFVIAAITDKIDGIWARKKKLVTDLGAFLDPLADKMLINLAFLALVYLDIMPIYVFAIILVRDFAIDGMRMMAARKNVTISASFYGKLKTTVQMIALIILIANMLFNLEFFAVVGNIALYLALALTIISGIDYLVKGSKILNKK